MSDETTKHPGPASGPPERPENRPGLALSSESKTEDSLPRRMRSSIEGAWKEASKLAETILDTLVAPPGGFSAVASGWLTSVFFFTLSVVVLAVIGLGALVLFFGLEGLALLVYAYPGALFLLSVAGGIAPPLILYWLLHSLLGIEGSWTAWGAYPLVLAGLFGSYLYWRFARVIATTGEGALAFYRGAAPKASQVFGAPFVVFAGVRELVEPVLGLFRSVAMQFFSLLTGSRGQARGGGGAAEDPTPPTPEGAVKGGDEGDAGE